MDSENEVQLSNTDGNCEPSTENHENKSTCSSVNENVHNNITLKSAESVISKEVSSTNSSRSSGVSTVEGPQNDLSKQDHDRILEDTRKDTSCNNKETKTNEDSMEIENVCIMNDGETTAVMTQSNISVPDSLPQSQVVFLDDGIIDGQDIRIPLDATSERIDSSQGSNSLLQYVNRLPQIESMVIDSAERHIPSSNGGISMSTNESTETVTSDNLIRQSFALPSTSQNDPTDNCLRKDMLFPHDNNIPTNCPLASIDKKISEIEATINIMEQKLPSSSSRIIFEESLFSPTPHENDESNDLSLRLNQENTNSNTETRSNTTDDNQSVTMGSEWFKAKKVDIYTEDTGPKLYNVTGKLVTPPLIPKKLTEVFSSLPIFGRPKNKAGLGEFQMDKIREFVGCGLNDQEFEALADYCSPEHLRTGKELIMDTSNPGHGFFALDNINENPHEGPELSVHRKYRLRVRKDVKNSYMKRLKHRGMRMMPLNQEEDEGPQLVTIGEPLQPGNDILFRVRVYRPFKYNPLDKYVTRTRHSVFSYDIVLHGRHKLSVLRDRFMCCNDVDMRVDVSDTPDDLPPTTAKDVFPSGCLFINNVFYVDTRKGCSDYSAPLRRWASKNGVGDFVCRDMCSVRLDELVVRLGHPEVYLHQGNCEHLFMFSEARVLGAGDPLSLSQYPRHSALSQNQTVYCTTCAEFAAKWIVVGCAGVPFDPAFFCDKCFKSYLYKDGKKIGDFKAYLYRGNEIK